MFRWARERAAIPVDALVKRFPRYLEWESGKRRPTLKQLENLARATHAPAGSFFLSEPLDEPFPIPDMRTIGDAPVGRHSVELRDTVYLCLQRQDWYRDYARIEGEDPLPFVGVRYKFIAMLKPLPKRSEPNWDLTSRRDAVCVPGPRR